MLHICLSLSLNTVVLKNHSEIESVYQNVYKAFLSFFYKHPKDKIALYFPGTTLSWIAREHPEFISLLEKLVARKQVEIVGGGYCNPLFPLIFPQDRTGQTELLTSEIRRLFGKRPRGAYLYKSVWDNALVSCFHNSGIEYVLLDSSLVSKESRSYKPYILTDFGKSIKVILQDRAFTPEVTVAPDIYIKSLIEAVGNEDSVVSINLDEQHFSQLYTATWLESFFELIRSNYEGSVDLSLPVDVIRDMTDCVPAFIPAGFEKDRYSGTVNEYLLENPKSLALYNRMVYVSILVNQCKGDRVRRNAAREHLWAAQNGIGYIVDNVLESAKAEHLAYKNLIEAEKLVRGVTDFKEYITAFDYDGDGNSEYVCSMKQFNAVISKKSGRITSLNIMQNIGNYADLRGFFTEALLSTDEFDDYKVSMSHNSDIFSQTLFKEKRFEGLRHEIFLEGHGKFSHMKLPVSLRKKYIVTSDGFSVQLVLNNESPFPLKGTLVVELVFAKTDYFSVDKKSYKAEVISGEEKKVLDGSVPASFESSCSYAQITDAASGSSFVLEPNEYCEFGCKTLGADLESAFLVSLCWNVDLAAGDEMEKNISFTIVPARK